MSGGRYAKAHDSFVERVKPAAVAHGASPEAVEAAFHLAAAIEFYSPADDSRDVMNALRAYWRAIKADV